MVHSFSIQTFKRFLTVLKFRFEFQYSIAVTISVRDIHYTEPVLNNLMSNSFLLYLTKSNCSILGVHLWICQNVARLLLSYFSKWNVMLCLKNNHSRDLNFKFQFEWSKVWLYKCGPLVAIQNSMGSDRACVRSDCESFLWWAVRHIVLTKHAKFCSYLINNPHKPLPSMVKGIVGKTVDKEKSNGSSRAVATASSGKLVQEVGKLKAQPPPPPPTALWWGGGENYFSSAYYYHDDLFGYHSTEDYYDNYGEQDKVPHVEHDLQVESSAGINVNNIMNDGTGDDNVSK